MTSWKDIESMAFELIDANKKMSRAIDKLFSIAIQHVGAEELDKEMYADMESAAKTMRQY